MIVYFVPMLKYLSLSEVEDEEDEEKVGEEGESKARCAWEWI